MKKFSLLFVVAAMFTVSCSSPLSMKKAAKEVSITCNPTQLEIKGNAIEAEWSATFPEKYFNKKAGLKLLPVLVYQGGEVAAPAKMLQGEKVYENYEVIKNTGGKTSQKVKFDYKPGMEKCHLELRAKLLHKNNEYDFDEPYKLATGTKSTALLVDNSGALAIDKDDYKKFTYKEQHAEIKYEVNKSNVRKAQLSKDDIKELKAFIDNAVADGNKVEYEGMQISAYASPEGKTERNEELSVERGQTANDAFAKLYSKKETKPEGPVEIKHTAEDWEGFQSLVSQSNMDDKDLIIRVLSMYKDSNVREQEIRNMSKVYTILESKVLPELRRSVMTAKVKVNNFSDEELIALTTTENASGLDADALLYAASLFDEDDYQSRAEIYKKAADKYEDERAINNYAAMLMQQGKTSEAKHTLLLSRANTPSIKNNLGVVALRDGDIEEAAKLFKEAGTDVAKQNLATIDISKGDYTSALKTLNGTNSFNEALVKYLTNDISGAKNILDKVNDVNGKASYLKAIIAAKEGNTGNITNYLNTAFSKDATLKNKIKNDITFDAIKNLIP